MAQWYYISRSDRFVLQWSPTLWIHTFNMSRANKYFNYICLWKFFSLHIAYSFVLLHYTASSHIILIIGVNLRLTNFWIGIVVGSILHIKIVIGDIRGIIPSHARCRSSKNGQIYSDLYCHLSSMPSKIMILDLVIELVKIHKMWCWQCKIIFMWKVFIYETVDYTF